MCCCLFVSFYLLLLSFAGEQFDKGFLERRKSFFIFFIYFGMLGFVCSSF